MWCALQMNLTNQFTEGYVCCGPQKPLVQYEPQNILYLTGS